MVALNVLKQAIDAYELLIQAYKTPLDIPQNAWIKGKDIEVGKWYLWVYGGGDYQISNEISREQYIIMIPEYYNGEGQTAQDFNVLWFLHGPNANLFDADYIDSHYADKENMQWHDIRDLELELESFGIVPETNWIVGPLDELDILLEFMNFLNWTENPLEVK